MSTRKILLSALAILAIYAASRCLGQLFGIYPRVVLVLPLMIAFWVHYNNQEFRWRDSATFWITVGLLVAIAQETLGNKFIIPNTILIGLLARTLLTWYIAESRSPIVRHLAYELDLRDQPPFQGILSWLLLVFTGALLVATYTTVSVIVDITGFTFFLITGNINGCIFNHLTRKGTERRLVLGGNYRLLTVGIGAMFLAGLIILPFSLWF